MGMDRASEQSSRGNPAAGRRFTYQGAFRDGHASACRARQCCSGETSLAIAGERRAARANLNCSLVICATPRVFERRRERRLREAAALSLSLSLSLSLARSLAAREITRREKHVNIPIN